MNKSTAMSRVLRNYSAARFNELYPIGSAFLYFPRMGVPDAIEVVTCSEAWELGHGEAVVRVSGIAGGVAVAHLTPDDARADSLGDVARLESIRRAWPEHHIVYQLATRLLWHAKHGNHQHDA